MRVLKQVRAGLVDQPVRMFMLAMFVFLLCIGFLFPIRLLLQWVRCGSVVQRNFDQLCVASRGSELVDFHLITQRDV